MALDAKTPLTNSAWTPNSLTPIPEMPNIDGVNTINPINPIPKTTFINDEQSHQAEVFAEELKTLLKNAALVTEDGSLVIGMTAGAFPKPGELIEKLLSALGKNTSGEPTITILGEAESTISITPLSLNKETIVELLEHHLGLNSSRLLQLSEEELITFLEIALQEMSEREEIIFAVAKQIISGKLINTDSINLLGQEEIEVQVGLECTVEAVMNLQKAAQNTNAVNVTSFSKEDVQSVLPRGGHGRHFGDLPAFLRNHGYNINQAFKWEEVIDSLIDETGVLYTQINGNHAVVVCGIKIENNKAYFLVANSMNPEIRAIEINHFLQIMSAPRIVNNPHVPQNYRSSAFLATWTRKEVLDQIRVM